MDERPIGIFDSGIGGLTVFTAVKKLLPDETILYLGDTARVPYGAKSPQTVVKYACECADFLAERGVKATVVACNTASAHALSVLEARCNVPVIGVIRPGARAALAASCSKVIGVIGTSGTIASNAYGNTLKALDPAVRVVSRACPLFVPLVEEGMVEGEAAEAVVRAHLAGMETEGIDTLILACTHYPLLKNAIAKRLGDSVRLVDSAETTAVELKGLLSRMGFLSSAEVVGRDHIYVTDLPARFEMVARSFLGEIIPQVTLVDL